MEISCIYDNRIIKAGYYFAKLVNVQVEDRGHDWPRVRADVLVAPNQGDASGTRLSSIIHDTPNSKFHFANFCNSFRIIDGDLLKARGRWASIEVIDACYNGTKYSAIKWVYQPRDIWFRSLTLEKEDEEGLVVWPD